MFPYAFLSLMRERPTFCCYLFTKVFALLTLSASSLLIVLRTYVLSNSSAVRKQPSIEVASIAIWNRNRVVMAMAIVIWCINAVVYVKCSLLLPCHDGDRELNITPIWLGHSYRACDYSILFMFHHVLIPSIAPLGAGTWPTDLCAGQHRKQST